MGFLEIAKSTKKAIQKVDYTGVNEMEDLYRHQEFLYKLLTAKDSFIRTRIIEQYLDIIKSYWLVQNLKINDINFQFNDLPSRLKTFSFLEINNPDDEMLITVLTKLLLDKQFIVNSNDIFEYILRRVERSYKGIHDIVDKLDVLSLEKKRQLTIPLIKEIL